MKTVSITKGSQKNHKTSINLCLFKCLYKVSDIKFFIITRIAKKYTGVSSECFCEITILLENLPQGVPQIR